MDQFACEALESNDDFELSKLKEDTIKSGRGSDRSDYSHYKCGNSPLGGPILPGAIFKNYSALRAGVSQDFIRQRFEILDPNSGRQRMDPFTFDLHHAIEMIELYGDRVPDLVNVIEEKNDQGEIVSEKPYRYDTLQCERLLKCPNGTTTTARGATSVFDCVTGGTQEILRRIVPVADDARDKQRIEAGISNATKGKYRQFLSHTPGTRDDEGKEFTRTVGHIDLQGFEVATFTLDLRTLTRNMTYGQDYKIGVYAGCTPCPVGYVCEAPGECSYPPPDQMSGIWNAGVYPEFGEVCSTCQSEKLPFFFDYEISGLATAKISEIDERGNLRFEGYPDSKHDIIQFNVGALRNVRIMVAVELLNGLYINNFERELANKGQFRIFKPDRALYGSGEAACDEWEPCTVYRRDGELNTELDGYLKAAQEKCEAYFELETEAQRQESPYWFLCAEFALSKCPHENPKPTNKFGERFNPLTGAQDKLTCQDLSPSTRGAYPYPYQIMEKPEWTQWRCQVYVGQKCCKKHPERCQKQSFTTTAEVGTEEALIYDPQTAYSFLSIITKDPFENGKLVAPYNMPKKDDDSMLRNVMIDRVTDWYVGDPSLAYHPNFLGWTKTDGNVTSLANGTLANASGSESVGEVGSATGTARLRRLESSARRLSSDVADGNNTRSNETNLFTEEYANMDANVQNALPFVAKDIRSNAGVLQSFWGNAGVDTLALPYLPFFSNCRGYDSHLYIHKLLEEHPFCAKAPNPLSYYDRKKYGDNHWNAETGYTPGYVTQWLWDHPKGFSDETSEKIDQCNHNPLFVESIEGVADLLGYHAQFKDKDGSLKHDRLYNRRLINQGVYKLLKHQAADDMSRCNYKVQDFDPLFEMTHPNNRVSKYYDAKQGVYMSEDPKDVGAAAVVVDYEYPNVEAPFDDLTKKGLGNTIYRMGCTDSKWRNPEYPSWCEHRDPTICPVVQGKEETEADRIRCCMTYHSRTGLEKLALRKLRETEKEYAAAEMLMREAQVQIEAGGTFDYKKDAASMSIFAEYPVDGNAPAWPTWDAKGRNSNPEGNVGMKLSCTYEESVFAPPAVSRWYEMPAGTPLFYLTKNPVPFSLGYSGTGLYDGEPAFEERVLDGGLSKAEWGRDPLFAEILSDTSKHVPVEIMEPGGEALMVPMTVRLNIGFFMRSDTDYTINNPLKGTWYKQLVTAGVEFLDFCTITEVNTGVRDALENPNGVTPKCNSSNGGVHDYVLEVNFYPMSFFLLLNAFQFDDIFYSLMFVLVGKSKTRTTVLRKFN